MDNIRKKKKRERLKWKIHYLLCINIRRYIFFLINPKKTLTLFNILIAVKSTCISREKKMSCDTPLRCQVVRMDTDSLSIFGS